MADPETNQPHHEAADTLPLEISHEEICAAHQSGAATPLSTIITDIVRYRDTWWIAHTSAWIRITDEMTNTRLDRHSEWANPQLLRDHP
jgi:hypothetical protein